MRLCKDSISTDDVFIRSVEAAPEPLCVLATKQQLVDLERFCTGAENFSVLSVDPTFNLGPFYVTPLTYNALTMRTTGGTHPSLLGPILVHQTKTFHAFYYFASTLIRLNPALKNVMAFGTDGEVKLIKAFHTAYPNAVHLRCTNHIRQNVKDKLRALGLPQAVLKTFLGDIFGAQVGTHFEEGLVDSADAASFTSDLATLETKWNNLEKGANPTQKPEFYSWFKQYTNIWKSTAALYHKQK